MKAVAFPCHNTYSMCVASADIKDVFMTQFIGVRPMETRKASPYIFMSVSAAVTNDVEWVM